MNITEDFSENDNKYLKPSSSGAGAKILSSQVNKSREAGSQYQNDKILI